MSREAMQMALEALEDANDVARMEFSDEDYYSEAINALRQALETEQEPVAWMDSDGFPWSKQGIECRTTKDTYTPLYTALPKREWVGLTDEDRKSFYKNAYAISDDELIERVESKLKEKNHG